MSSGHGIFLMICSRAVAGSCPSRGYRSIIEKMAARRSAASRGAADAEAICEAVMRPTMRFVPIKSVEQQSAAMSHRSRALLIKQRTMLLHAIRAHLAELGIRLGPDQSRTRLA